MCNCAHEIGEQLGRIESGQQYLKDATDRRLHELEQAHIDTQGRINTVISEQTLVNSAIHGRISRVKYLTLGVLALGTSLGLGLDWFMERITKIGN